MHRRIIMGNINRIILLVICFLFLVLSGTAGAQNYQNVQIPCICLDEYGAVINYPVNDPASVFCYSCTGDNVCVKTDLTLQMCQMFNVTATAQAAAAAAAAQPVVTAEPPAPASAPVQESAPVKEEPAPVPVEAAPAPVKEEPAPAPVEAAPAPVKEEPAPAPVEAAPAPVKEEPVPAPVEAAPAPVKEEAAPASVEAALVPVEAAPVEAAPVYEESVPVSVQESAPDTEELSKDTAAIEIQPVIVPVLMSAGNNAAAAKSGGEGKEEPSAEPTEEGNKEEPSVKLTGEGNKEEPSAESAGEGNKEEPSAEPTGEGNKEEPSAEPTGEGNKEEPSAEPTGEGNKEEPSAEPTGEGNKEEPSAEPAGEGNKEEPPVKPAEEGNKEEPSAEPAGEGNKEEPPAEPAGEGNKEEPSAEPAGEGNKEEPPAEPAGEGNKEEPPVKPAEEGNEEEPPVKPAEEGNEEEQPSEPETMERPVDYIVKAGDTCESITKHFDVDYDLFMIMNDMDECSITVDQSVHIPTVEEEEILKAAEKEAPIMPMLLSSGISIEGKLKDLGLSSPSGETFTTAAVPFTWVYTVSDDSNPVEVTFNLTLVINNLENGQKTTSTTVVSSANCKNFICTYTAGSELSGFKKADVTWTVSGEYDNGGTAVTINAANPAEKTFKLDVKDPAPKPEPDPKPKPPEKPQAPVQECPVGRYTVRSLGFYWAPSANADIYTVVWYNDREQSGKLELSNDDPTCKQGRCIAYTTLPGVGKYAWTVTAKNASGSAESKVMKFEIATNVSTPTPYLPNGTVFNSTYPAFQWEDVEDGVFEYRIQIVGKYDGRIRYDRWFEVEDIYVGNGVCYVKTDLFLPAGSYSWRVLGRNKDFNSRWSSWLDFYVQCDYCNFNNVYFGNYANTIPSTSYPTAVITNMSPEYQWRTLTGAANYLVKVIDASGKEVFAEQVPSSYCTVEMCTWDPGIKLPGNGKYTWTVSGYGPSGGFWGSSNGSFTVQAQIVINPMSFVSPEQNGYLNPDAPLIIWTDPGDTAVLFDVKIFDGNNNSLLNAELDRDQAWCDGLTCSIAFQTIPDGDNYRIAITPYSEYNTTGDMIELVFSKGGKSIRLSSPKEGSVVQPRPLFRWLLEDGEDAAYDLILTDAENNVMIYSPLVCGSGGVTCEDGEAFYSPAEALAAGSYIAVLDIPKAGVNGEAVTFIVQ